MEELFWKVLDLSFDRLLMMMMMMCVFENSVPTLQETDDVHIIKEKPFVFLRKIR